jgi:haloalkane dehalogenase
MAIMIFDVTPYRDLYPFDSRWLDRDGLRYHYLDEGQGDPVVCVHGNPTWSFYFRELIKNLRADHRVIAGDHIGCGLSDKPGDDRYDYVLRRRVEDLEALIDHLDLGENITLVLHDWGGMIGSAVAVRRPERIQRIVLLNTAAFMKPPDKPLPIRLWLIRNIAPFAAVAVRGFNAFSYLATHMACKTPMDPRVRAAFTGPYNSWQNRIATLRFVQDIPMRPGDPSFDLAKSVDDSLEKLSDIPMFIGWGKQDFVFDDAFLAEWRRRFPNADVHEFPQAGHYVLEDVPDLLIPKIRDFLQTHPLRTLPPVATEVAS